MNTYDDLRTAIDLLGGQTAVSRRFEIPYRTVQNWYAGIRNPPPYVASMIFEIERSENEAQEIIFEQERKLEALNESEELQKAKKETEAERKINAVLQEQFNAAMELADMRRKEIEGLEKSIQDLEGQIAYLKKEVEKQKEARMIWARAAGQKHL